MASLLEKITSREAKVSVIGLGYVGLPLAVELAKAGFDVTGFDVMDSRAKEVNRGESYIGDISSNELASVTTQVQGKGKLRATSDFGALRHMDTVSICVPTPLSKTRDPDISYVVAVRDQIEANIHSDMLVILESTTYPGTTEEVFLPIVEKAKLTLGKNFFLAFSPERIDPANPKFNVRNTPKVVGGFTPACTNLVMKLYGTFVDKLVPVGSTRVAEMVKILENTFRAVNIGLVNEVSIMCRILGIDTWEVIDAAATKPFGFTPFYPGPGLGGHCIPVDPHYLSWKLKAFNYTARFIDLAAEVNSSMPHQVLELISDKLNQAERSVRGAKILLLGVAYKPNVSDMRESPALDIFQLLEKKGAQVTYSDPYVPEITLENQQHSSVPFNAKTLAEQDLVVITTHHKDYDYKMVVEASKAIVDTRNATKGITSPKIIRL